MSPLRLILLGLAIILSIVLVFLWQPETTTVVLVIALAVSLIVCTAFFVGMLAYETSYSIVEWLKEKGWVK